MAENQTKTQAQAEPEIQLTLTPEELETENNKELASLNKPGNEIANPENPAEKTVVKDPINEDNLTDTEKNTVNEFSKKIDITESNTVLEYGASAQKKVSDFSDTALSSVRTKDLGEIGDLLTNLVGELKDSGEEKKGFLAGLFDKGEDAVVKMRARYDKASQNVDKVAGMLEDHQITLLKDISLLDELYQRNATNTKELTMYILAGRKKLEDVRTNELPKLIEKAKQTKLPEDAQTANDLQQACVRFEKKLYDLELTRQVSIQMAPQIRLVQNNDTLMTEKIQSTLVNTIPLWKNQIVLSLGIQHSKEAMEAEREVTNMTNDLLKKNADTLHQATVDTAKESERGIVDIETLQHTNEQLISTLDEVMQIQKDGHEKRQAAEQELARIETQLTDKLSEINDSNNAVKKAQ
jgi:uncharacterized protein YaaN involved in tellurite resistance